MPLENDFTPETTEVRKAHKFDEEKTNRVSSRKIAASGWKNLHTPI